MVKPINFADGEDAVTSKHFVCVGGPPPIVSCMYRRTMALAIGNADKTTAVGPIDATWPAMCGHLEPKQCPYSRPVKIKMTRKD